ncbi:MAG: DUF2090 domain-containing protein [Proteobacteria bacterium]|nr:DUF2090 domain-containing protein [Pseudomonadota bacterium]
MRIGHSIFGGPAEAWLGGKTGDRSAVEAMAGAFERLVSLWRERE